MQVQRGRIPLHFFGNSAGVLKPLALACALHVDPGEDHGQLRRLEFDAVGCGGGGHLERSAFESLVPDRQPVAIEVEDLEAIPAAVEEEEEMAGQEVLSEALLNQPRKAIKTFAHVCRSGTEEHAHGGGELREHHSAPRAPLPSRPAARMAIRSNTGSTAPVSRTTQALGNSISSCPWGPA